MKKSLIIGGVTVAVIASLTGLVKLRSSKNDAGKSSETIVVNNPTVTNEQLGGYPTTNTLINKKNIIKFNNVNQNRVVYFVDEFSFQSTTKAVEQLKKLEKQSSDPIWLLIDSPGGSVIDGATLISQIEASKAPVYTVCTRLCASMAAFLHSYGHKRYMLDRAILMYHPASASAQGQLPNMISLLKTVQRLIDKMNSNIYTRAKLSKVSFEKLVSYELWIDSEDATNMGLNDAIVNLNVMNMPNYGGSSESAPQERKPSKSTTKVTFDLKSQHVF